MDSERFARIKRAFIEASALPVKDRNRFLRELAVRDAEIVAELESLLVHHDSRTRLPAESLTGHARTTTTESGQKFLFRWPVTGRFSPLSSFHWLFVTASSIMLLVLLGGLWIYTSLRQQLLETEAAQLQAHCRAAATDLEKVFERELEMAHAIGRRVEIQRYVRDILEESARSVSLATSQTGTARQTLLNELAAVWGPETTYALWNRRHLLVAGELAGSNGQGQAPSDSGHEILRQVWETRRPLLVPHGPGLRTSGSARGEMTGMSLVIPVFPQVHSDAVIGALQICNLQLDERFQSTCLNRQFRNSGETYAFSRDGRMISRSRNHQHAVQLGLIEPDSQDFHKRQLWIRDPGCDLTAGETPREPRIAWPRTRMLRYAMTGEPGYDIAGYRDYRGRLVVGAWRWLPDYGLGIAVEIDHDEVIGPLQTLDTGFLTAIVLLLTGGLLLVACSHAQNRTTSARRQRLGDYHLERLLGQGGMGTVYKARHELLGRSAAVKILKPEVVSRTAIRRFSREVQYACRLEHPNTVDIYDFGCTQDGRFYYSMEYLSGLTISDLVRLFGALPPGRAVFLLRQVCGSLREAHGLGLVHRDIKPQNIMVCVCGGETDVVKVLDFGLVKESNECAEEHDTIVTEWVGTPRYTAPERLLQPSISDFTSDIYSLGAVAFLMLTGSEIYAGTALDQLISDIVLRSPEFPQAAATVPTELQDLVMRCLARECTRRPESVDEILRELDRIQQQYPWTSALSERWWQEHLPQYFTDRDATFLHEPADMAAGSGAPVEDIHCERRHEATVKLTPPSN